MKNRIRDFFADNAIRFVALQFGVAMIINYIIETLGRQSAVQGVRHVINSPAVFFCNTAIIFATLAVAILLRRRRFVLLLIAFAWLAMGITNGVILRSRMTPFTIKDLDVFKDGISIIPNYLSPGAIAVTLVGIVTLFGLLALFFIYGDKKTAKITYKKRALFCAAALTCSLTVTAGAVSSGIMATFFGNLAYAYRDYGVAYCFLNTWLNTGIKKPAHYSQESILEMRDGIKAAMGGEDSTSLQGLSGGEFLEKGPAGSGVKIASGEESAADTNIIFVQLESFIDPAEIKFLELSEDAIPNFRKLTEEFSSGTLIVPSVGAGTANTEFEVLSGMSVKYFGPGEYPYKSVLLEQTCETVAYNLKDMGYKTHAIHNHRGAFYGRNKVFKNLGFDTFTSLEYMNHVEKTPKGWAKDRVLTQEISAALDATEGKDFIFTVSVQPHGKYPSKQVIEDPKITVNKAPSEDMKWKSEYYCNQIYEVDRWIGDLLSSMRWKNENTVIVFYGDHLPALEIDAEDMKSGSWYQTQYVIWDNMGLPREEKTIYAYQLAAEVLGRLNINSGTMNLFHRANKDTLDYRIDMKKLQYDMLYGKQYIYGGASPFRPTKMKMGVRPITIEDVVQIGNKYCIKGENFTPYSKISLDGEILETKFISSSFLGLLEEIPQEKVKDMKISQVEITKQILSTTE